MVIFAFLFCSLIFVGSTEANTQTEVSIDFNVAENSLCFQNKDPRLGDHGALGRYGVKEGVCQGMAGIAAAFIENVKFNPNASKLSPVDTKTLINQIVRLHTGNCKVTRVIPGYANLQEFCKANVELFLKKSIANNADIAVREIAVHLPQFLRLKRKPISTAREQQQLLATLQGFWKKLEAGKSPLMLVYSHVVNLTAISNELLADGRTRIVLKYYDSNNNADIYSREITLGRDGLPELTNSMVWDVTPERAGVRCE